MALENQKEKILQDREKIEIDSMKNGLVAILKTKFFNEWRDIKQRKLTKEQGPKKLIDEDHEEKTLIGLITDTFNKIKQRIKKEEEEER